MKFALSEPGCSNQTSLAAFGPKRSFAAGLALSLARVAAGAARRGLMLERSGAERADCPVVLARRSGRGTRCVRFALCARTAAARMMTKCAARTDPRAGLAGRAGPVAQPLARHKQSTGLFVSGARLLGVPEIAPAGLRLPRRWASGVRDVGARAPLQRVPAHHAGVAGGCTGMLEVFAHAAQARAPTTVVAPNSWCATTASARDCKQHGADARRVRPGLGVAPARMRTSATGRKQVLKQPSLCRCYGAPQARWSN